MRRAIQTILILIILFIAPNILGADTQSDYDCLAEVAENLQISNYLKIFGTETNSDGKIVSIDKVSQTIVLEKYLNGSHLNTEFNISDADSLKLIIGRNLPIKFAIAGGLLGIVLARGVIMGDHHVNKPWEKDNWGLKQQSIIFGAGVIGFFAGKAFGKSKMTTKTFYCR